MKPTETKTHLTRRNFIRNTTLAGSAMILPRHVLGFGAVKGANEKLNIAGIGVGGQGAGDIDKMDGENIVALCDVDWDRAAGTFKRYPKAKRYKDYRKMLEEQKDIDAVVVATPDHSHAFASMMAIKLGKHVYCEKPLTHSVWEARQLTRAAREARVATQMGNQAQASEATRQLCEMVWDGAIGEVREVHVWTDRPSNGLFKEYWPQGLDRPTGSPATPKNLDWDLWLGPAPERPYHPAYVPFAWRGWWDFGTGALGDIGCHAFDAIFRALKLGAPTSVEATSTRVNKESYPLASTVYYEFPARGEMPPVKLTWYDGGLRPARPPQMEEGRVMDTTGKLLIGSKGAIITQQMNYALLPATRQKEYGEAPKKLARSVGHYQEWIDACKGGQSAGSNFDWAGPLTETVLLGNVALRVQLREEMVRRKLLWDPEKFSFTNCAEANEFLRREYRQGWKLA